MFCHLVLSTELKMQIGKGLMLKTLLLEILHGGQFIYQLSSQNHILWRANGYCYVCMWNMRVPENKKPNSVHKSHPLTQHYEVSSIVLSQYIIYSVVFTFFFSLHLSEPLILQQADDHKERFDNYETCIQGNTVNLTKSMSCFSLKI